MTHSDSVDSGRPSDAPSAYDDTHEAWPGGGNAPGGSTTTKSRSAMAVSTRFFIAAAVLFVLRSIGWLVVLDSGAMNIHSTPPQFLTGWADTLSILLYVGALALLVVALVRRRSERFERGALRFSPLGIWLGLGLIILPRLETWPLRSFTFNDVNNALSGAFGEAFVFRFAMTAEVFGILITVLPFAFLIVAIVLGFAKKPPVSAQDAQLSVGAPAATGAASATGFPASASPTNTMAIVAFISAFFVSPVAIILGHLALAEVQRTHQSGRGLAIAALCLGYGAVAIALLSLVVLAALGVVFG